MTWKRKIIIALIAIILLTAAASAYFTFACYSDGDRAGNVIKFSRKGIVFKTWEGELVQRNFSTAPTDTWVFSCESDAIAQQINEAMTNGKRLKLHYCQRYYTFFWQGDTEYFIDGVTVVPE